MNSPLITGGQVQRHVDINHDGKVNKGDALELKDIGGNLKSGKILGIYDDKNSGNSRLYVQGKDNKIYFVDVKRSAGQASIQGKDLQNAKISQLNFGKFTITLEPPSCKPPLAKISDYHELKAHLNELMKSDSGTAKKIINFVDSSPNGPLSKAIKASPDGRTVTIFGKEFFSYDTKPSLKVIKEKLMGGFSEKQSFDAGEDAARSALKPFGNAELKTALGLIRNGQNLDRMEDPEGSSGRLRLVQLANRVGGYRDLIGGVIEKNGQLDLTQLSGTQKKELVVLMRMADVPYHENTGSAHFKNNKIRDIKNPGEYKSAELIKYIKEFRSDLIKTMEKYQKETKDPAEKEYLNQAIQGLKSLNASSKIDSFTFKCMQALAFTPDHKFPVKGANKANLNPQTLIRNKLGTGEIRDAGPLDPTIFITFLGKGFVHFLKEAGKHTVQTVAGEGVKAGVGAMGGNGLVQDIAGGVVGVTKGGALKKFASSATGNMASTLYTDGTKASSAPVQSPIAAILVDGTKNFSDANSRLAKLPEGIKFLKELHAAKPGEQKTVMAKLAALATQNNIYFNPPNSAETFFKMASDTVKA